MKLKIFINIKLNFLFLKIIFFYSNLYIIIARVFIALLTT